MSANKLECDRLGGLIGFLRKLTFIFIVLFGVLAVARSAYPVDVSTAPAVNLKKIRAYVGEGFSSIILKFDKEFRFDDPVIKENEVLATFKNASSQLEPFRELKHVDSWVKLEKAESDLVVSIGLPKDFSSLKYYRLRKGYQYVIKMYKGNETSANLRNLQSPVPVSPGPSEKTEAIQIAVKDPDPLNQTSSSSTERPEPEKNEPAKTKIDDSEPKSVVKSESENIIKIDTTSNLKKANMYL